MAAPKMSPQELQFRSAAEHRGLVLPAVLVVGKIGRCPVSGKPSSNKAGAYLWNPGNNIATGWFENHTDGQGVTYWQADLGRELTPKEEATFLAQRKADQAKEEADTKAKQATAAKVAAQMWAEAKPCKTHGYLTKKCAKSFGLRVSGDLLLIPAYNEKGVLATVQKIGPDGTKRFHPGGKKQGSFFLIGTITDGCTIHLVEGYATGASVHEATGHPVVVAYDSGNLPTVAEIVRRKYPNHTLVICGDSDDDKPRPDNPGRTAALAAALAVGGQAVFPDFGPARVEGQTDFNDLHQAQGLEAVKQCIEQSQDAAHAAVVKLLARNGKGLLASIPANLTKIIRHDRMFGSHLSLNEMSREVCYDREPKSDHWVHDVQEWLQDNYGLNFGATEIQAKLLAQAASNPFHPVREYLNSRKWDGKARLSRVATEILGTEPNKLYSTYITKFHIAAVRRAKHPGCKVDTVLTIIGRQGFLKSSYFDVLGGEFFNDSPIDMSNKDGALVLHRSWISELPEIDHNTSNTAVERMKAFISSRKDIFRPPYAVSTEVYPRSCIMVGTSNREGYLTDSSGSRRFWTIQVDKPANLELLREWRDQLWAEAVVLEEDPANTHWLDEKDEAAREIDAERFECEDPWESKFLGWVERVQFPRSHVGTPDDLAAGKPMSALMTALEIPDGQQNRAGVMRLSAILKKHGWEQGIRKHGGPRLWAPRVLKQNRKGRVS
jgi:predicted P-loop ATPase